MSTAKIVLFHQGSTELRRCENCVFFLPVNILTGVTRRLLGPHDTLPCVLISPLVFSTSVGTVKEDTIICKHLAHLLSEKWSSPCSVVMGWLRCSLGLSLLHSSIMCIRGSHSRSKHPCVCFQLSTLLLLRGTCLL